MIATTDARYLTFHRRYAGSYEVARSTTRTSARTPSPATVHIRTTGIQAEGSASSSGRRDGTRGSGTQRTGSYAPAEGARAGVVATTSTQAPFGSLRRDLRQPRS